MQTSCCLDFTKCVFSRVLKEQEESIMFFFLACAVSAMLCEVVLSGVSSKLRASGVEGEEVKDDLDFDVVLCQSELVERALQLCHLLPPGVMPVSLYSYHTYTHPVCLIQWMFNGAEQPFILLCCLYLRQRKVLDCICMCMCFIRLTSRAPILSQYHFFSLFGHLSFHQLLFLVSFA